MWVLGFKRLVVRIFCNIWMGKYLEVRAVIADGIYNNLSGLECYKIKAESSSKVLLRTWSQLNNGVRPATRYYRPLLL